MIHLINANPALDFDFRLSDPSSGKIGAVESFTVSPGGKSLNVARFLKQLKVPARLWAPLGEKEATQALYFHLAHRQGIPIEWVRDDGPVRANVVVHDRTGSAKFNHAGFPIRPLVWERPLARKLKPGDLLVLSGRLPEANAGLYGDWVLKWARRGVRTALDASGRALKRGMTQKPWFLKVNLDEFNGVWAKPCASLSQVASQVPALRRRGLQQGAVTHGAEGALVWDGEHVFGVRNASPRRHPLVVGAGDGFLAGYLAAFQAGLDLADRCRWASAAARVVADRGIEGFTAAAFQKALPRVRLLEVDR